MGNYHPHGDQAIYDALVRMAQPFSLRYPLVDPQGNFGNVDGYPAGRRALHRGPPRAMADGAAARHRPGHGRLRPELRRVRARAGGASVRFPNLLVNGATGSRSGMATNIPPHNLAEIDRRRRRDDRRPDDRRRAAHAARKGPGLPDRRDHPRPRGHPRGVPLGPRPDPRPRAAPTSRSCAAASRAIIVSELPYGVKKGGDEGVIAKIADLVREASSPRSPTIATASRTCPARRHADLDRAQARRGASGRLNKLYQHTAAADDVRVQRRRARRRRPAHAVAARADPHYLDHQREVVTRRLKFELRNAVAPRARARGLPDRARQHRRGDRADPRLREHRDRAQRPDGEFGLCELQAHAILEMRLRA